MADFDFDKDLDVDVDVDLDFDTDIDFDKLADIDIEIDSNINLEGNVAMLTVDAQAIGGDTLVEVDAAVLAIEGQLSSVTLWVLSAVD